MRHRPIMQFFNPTYFALLPHPRPTLGICAEWRLISRVGTRWLGRCGGDSRIGSTLRTEPKRLHRSLLLLLGLRCNLPVVHHGFSLAHGCEHRPAGRGHRTFSSRLF